VTVEIWSPIAKAGLKNYKYIDWFREHPVEDDVKIFKWANKNLKTKAMWNGTNSIIHNG